MSRDNSKDFHFGQDNSKEFPFGQCFGTIVPTRPSMGDKKVGGGLQRFWTVSSMIHKDFVQEA